LVKRSARQPKQTWEPALRACRPTTLVSSPASGFSPWHPGQSGHLDGVSASDEEASGRPLITARRGSSGSRWSRFGTTEWLALRVLRVFSITSLTFVLRSLDERSPSRCARISQRWPCSSRPANRTFACPLTPDRCLTLYNSSRAACERLSDSPDCVAGSEARDDRAATACEPCEPPGGATMKQRTADIPRISAHLIGGGMNRANASGSSRSLGW
jgi:hypothetical protein